MLEAKLDMAGTREQTARERTGKSKDKAPTNKIKKGEGEGAKRKRTNEHSKQVTLHAVRLLEREAALSAIVGLTVEAKVAVRPNGGVVLPVPALERCAQPVHVIHPRLLHPGSCFVGGWISSGGARKAAHGVGLASHAPRAGPL